MEPVTYTMMQSLTNADWMNTWKHEYGYNPRRDFIITLDDNDNYVLVWED